MKDDSVYLAHILEACDRIGSYVAGGRNDFFSKTLIQDAVVRNLEIVGEASKQLSASTQAVHPDVPWRAMTRMRDRLIHAYFGVDWALVWETASVEVPDLARKIRSILATD